MEDGDEKLKLTLLQNKLYYMYICCNRLNPVSVSDLSKFSLGYSQYYHTYIQYYHTYIQ